MKILCSTTVGCEDGFYAILLVFTLQIERKIHCTSYKGLVVSVGQTKAPSCVKSPKRSLISPSWFLYVSKKLCMDSQGPRLSKQGTYALSGPLLHGNPPHITVKDHPMKAK